jgi:hypothetical protein
MATTPPIAELPYSADAVAADSPNVDAFAAETRAGRLVVNAGRISQYICKGYRQAVCYFCPGQHRDIAGDVADGTRILVRHNHNFVERACFPVVLLRVGHRQAQHGGQNKRSAVECCKFIACMWHQDMGSASLIHSVDTLPNPAAQTIGRYTYYGDAGTYLEFGVAWRRGLAGGGLADGYHAAFDRSVSVSQQLIGVHGLADQHAVGQVL